MDDQNNPNQPASSPEEPRQPEGESAQPAAPVEPAAPAQPAPAVEPAQPAEPVERTHDAEPPIAQAPAADSVAAPQNEAAASQAPAMPQPPAPQQPPVQPAAPQPTQPYGQAAQQPYQPTQQQPYQQPPQAPGQAPAPYGQPASPYGGQPAAGYYQPNAPRTSGKATGALICGIAAILLSGLPLLGIILGIVAIVLAGKAVKEAGKDGKTTGGKVCGIIGIVFSVIAFILYLVIGIGAIAYEASHSTYVPPASTEDSSDYSSPSTPTDESEKQLEALATTELDKFKNKDSAAVQELATKLDEAFVSSSGYSLTELGIEPTAFVEWMLTDFDYSLDGAYDYGDGTGVVYAEVDVLDYWVFSEAFMKDAQTFMDSDEIAGMDEAALKVRLGELLQGAMDQTTEMTDSYIAIEFLEEGGTWVVDQDAWEDQKELLFGVY